MDLLALAALAMTGASALETFVTSLSPTSHPPPIIMRDSGRIKPVLTLRKSFAVIKVGDCDNWHHVCMGGIYMARKWPYFVASVKKNYLD